MTAPFPHLPRESWERYLSDELGEVAAERIEAHLASCPPCRHVLEAQDPTRVFRRLRGLRVREERWEGFWDGIRAEMRRPQEDGEPTPELPSTRQPTRHGGRLRGLAAAAVVVACAAVAWTALRPDEKPSVAAGRPGTSTTAPGSGTETIPCPPAMAHLNLTRRECEELARPIHLSPETDVIIRPDLDLRDL